MTKRGLKQKFLKWCDGWRLAAMGIVLASRKAKFWLVFLLSFVIFGTLLSLLSGGSGALNLFFATDFSGKLKILGDGFLALFGINRSFWDWAMVFFIAVVQGLLIALIVLVWKKRTKKGGASAGKKTKSIEKKGESNNQEKSSSRNAENASQDNSVQNAGIVAGLAILGSGCPTCGTALITPILGTIFSSGSYAIAGTVSGVITLAAFLIAILTLKKVGEEAYVIIVDEKWRKKQSEK